MTSAERAKELFIAVMEAAIRSEAEAVIASAITQAQNDKLEEAARLMERVMADSKAALIRTLKIED